MKATSTTTLIIDDHLLLVQIYRYVLKDIESSDSELNFEIVVANDSDTAFSILNQMEAEAQNIDLVLIDLKIPAAESDRLMIGEDIGLAIKLRFPNAKVIVYSSSNNNYWIYNILKSIKPEGFG